MQLTTHERHVALVTGAAQGIGQAIALELARRGATVIATDLSVPDETVSKIGPAAHGFQLDVTQEEAWRSLSLECRAVGEVDIVVNNAGYFPNRPIDQLDLPTWRRTIATNLDSHFLSAKVFLPRMRRKKWGRFVGISSNMVGLAIPGMSHYIASKMGIVGFMRGLANDVASDGITANAVLPGLTNTQATAPQSEDAEARHLGTTGHQTARTTRGCDRRGSISDERRRCLHHWAGHRRRRRSVPHRLIQRKEPEHGASSSPSSSRDPRVNKAAPSRGASSSEATRSAPSRATPTRARRSRSRTPGRRSLRRRSKTPRRSRRRSKERPLSSR